MTSFNSRTGLVGTEASPKRRGRKSKQPDFHRHVPAAPTATVWSEHHETTAFVLGRDRAARGGRLADLTRKPGPRLQATQLRIATTAFVQAALNAQSQVTTFNTCGGAPVLLPLADVTGVGYISIVPSVFTGDSASADTGRRRQRHLDPHHGVREDGDRRLGVADLRLLRQPHRPHPFGLALVSTNPGTGVFATSSAAHGITTGQVGITSATAPSALGQRPSVLSKRDLGSPAIRGGLTPRPTPTCFTSVGSATGWAVKLVTLHGTRDSAKNLDYAISRSGSGPAHNNIFLEFRTCQRRCRRTSSSFRPWVTSTGRSTMGRSGGAPSGRPRHSAPPSSAGCCCVGIRLPGSASLGATTYSPCTWVLRPPALSLALSLIA